MKDVKQVAILPQIPRRKRVAAYARVSSGKDAMLQSLSAQVSYYSAFIQRRIEWEFAGVYADEAVTGTKDRRAEFQRMLSDCRNGTIDLILAKSISRFARNTLTTLETVRELKNLGVDVFFERENIHSVSGDGELMLSILASYAQEESRSASENCKWRIRKRFESGELIGMSYIYGYHIEKGKIELDPIQAAVVTNIFNHYINGMGCERIAKTLNALEIPTLKGRQWDTGRISNILKNEKYTGNSLLQKSFTVSHLTKQRLKNTGQLPQYYVEGTHPAIVSVDTFQKAQTLLKERGQKYAPARRSASAYPFTGMIRCGVCGKNYRRKHTLAGTKYEKIVWICSSFNSRGKSACPSQQIPENILMSKTAEILGLTAFDETEFKAEITEIRVPEHSKLVFIFRDGHAVPAEWQNHSRRDSWTEEMKQAARTKERDRQNRLLTERRNES
jgi:DNA invertase Pin-like site-specific DNA recombinase